MMHLVCVIRTKLIWDTADSGYSFKKTKYQIIHLKHIIYVLQCTHSYHHQCFHFSLQQKRHIIIVPLFKLNTVSTDQWPSLLIRPSWSCWYDTGLCMCHLASRQDVDRQTVGAPGARTLWGREEAVMLAHCSVFCCTRPKPIPKDLLWLTTEIYSVVCDKKK